VVVVPHCVHALVRHLMPPNEPAQRPAAWGRSAAATGWAAQAKACGSLRTPNRLPRSPCSHHPDIADENPLIGAAGVDDANFGGPTSVGVEQQLGSVGRPNWVIARCRSWRFGQLRLVAAVLVHDPNLAVGVLDPRPVSNPLAVQPRRSVGTAAFGRVIIF